MFGYGHGDNGHMDQEPSHRSFENRELDMSKFIDITNPEIMMSEILTELELLDQDMI
jgi:hypothetical protein